MPALSAHDTLRTEQRKLLAGGSAAACKEKENDMFTAHKKKQPQTQPVTPAKSKQGAPLKELTDHELEQVAGGFASIAACDAASKDACK